MKVQTAESKEWGLEAQTGGLGSGKTREQPFLELQLARCQARVEQWPPGLTQVTLKSHRQCWLESSKVVSCTARGHTATATGGNKLGLERGQDLRPWD